MRFYFDVVLGISSVVVKHIRVSQPHVATIATQGLWRRRRNLKVLDQASSTALLVLPQNTRHETQMIEIVAIFFFLMKQLGEKLSQSPPQINQEEAQVMSALSLPRLATGNRNAEKASFSLCYPLPVHDVLNPSISVSPHQ